MQKHPKTFIVGLSSFYTEMRELLRGEVFILLTVLGNLVIGIFSFIFYFLEHERNPKIHQYIDALWWGFATATTTGYGDITPVTAGGKILGIVLMLTGMALFGMFTALFADAILTRSRRTK